MAVQAPKSFPGERVEDVTDFETTRNFLRRFQDKVRFFLEKVTGDLISVDTDDWTYHSGGTAQVNGSWRTGVVKGDLVIQQRVAGTWTFVAAYEDKT